MNQVFANLWSIIFLDEPLGLSINLLILGLFLLGCHDVFRALKRLAQERGWIAQASGKLQDASGKCPKGALNEVLDFFGIPDNSLLGRRIARVLRLRAAGLGQRDVLQQLTAERIEGYGALARHIGVTLTLLGLLGTVFGMSLALFNIQDALRGVNDIEGLNALVAALGETLRSMKTAFGCTLAGLLTAIVLSFLNYRVRRQQSAVARHLEEHVACELLPALQEVNPDADAAAKIFAQVVVDAADELEKTGGKIADASNEFTGASGVTAEAAKSFDSAVASFGANVSQVLGNQQVFTEMMRETQRALREMTEASTKQSEGVRAFIESANQMLERRLAAIEEGANANRALQEDLKRLAESFGPAIVGYHNQFKEAVDNIFTEFKASFNQTLKEINDQYKTDVLGQLSSNQQAFQQMLAKHEDTLQQLIKQNQQQMSELFGQQRTALHDFADLVGDAKFNLGSMYQQMRPDGGGGQT